jgi:molybdopterin-guanine dinucleotide biosynthesis protein B
MRTFGIVGHSGNGKTTLLVKVVPILVDMGLTVSTMKHAHHGFDVDTPGKDSYRHRTAGATEVMMTSSRRWVLQHELRGAPEPTIEELLSHMTPVDLVLIEGFKTHPHAKVEVFRESVGAPPLYPGDPTIVAVASDAPLADAKIPVLDIDDAHAVADFIVGHCQLKAA